MLPKQLSEGSHRRYNPLTREWVLISPHRAKRPWLGQVEKIPPENLPSYDPSCYLCPGNERAAGRRNPPYTRTFVFDNDFPALLRLDDVAEISDRTAQTNSSSLLIAQPETGICRVVCFSPRHDLTLPEMNTVDIETVISTWTDQTVELGSLDFIYYVQVFENKGALMGCSNPHPHSQIWASNQIPVEPSKELISQVEYFSGHGSCLHCKQNMPEPVAESCSSFIKYL